MRSPEHTGLAPLHPHPLPGTYRAHLQGMNCELELRLDHMGCLTGSFAADGERLDVFGGMPSNVGEVYGVIRENMGGETLAVFRAVPRISELVLELDVPGHDDRFMLAETIVFERVALA